MPLQSRHKVLVLSAIGCASAALGGIGLAHYAKGESFSFYQERSSGWTEVSSSQAPSPGWTYPADAPQPQPANYAPLPTIPEYQPPPLPRDEYAAVYRASETPVFTDGAPGEDGDDATQSMVQVTSGSWVRSERSSADEDATAEVPGDRQADADATGDTAAVPSSDDNAPN